MHYKGKIHIKDKTYFFMPASVSDAPAISKLYEQTKIDETNYTTKLNPKHKDNFSEKGGMFVVLNEQEIETEIINRNNLWAVIKNEDGELEGSFWFSTENQAFNGSIYENKQMVYPREIVVSKERQAKYIGHLLYYTAICSFLEAGYQQGVCDVYKVKSYNQIQNVNLLNKPSSRLLEHLSATYQGPFPIKRLSLGTLEVRIEPQIYTLDLKKIKHHCETFFREHSIEIIWG